VIARAVAYFVNGEVKLRARRLSERLKHVISEDRPNRETRFVGSILRPDVGDTSLVSSIPAFLLVASD